MAGVDAELGVRSGQLRRARLRIAKSWISKRRFSAIRSGFNTKRPFLTDCIFRDLPQATTYEEEISAEPWFSVSANDVFPEEFPNFLRLPGPARAALLEQHSDLFHPDFWRSVQRKLREGEILEVFPYRPERRLVTAN